MKSKLLKNSVFHFNVELMYSTNRDKLKKAMKLHMKPEDYQAYGFEDSIDAFFYYHSDLDMWFLFLNNNEIPVLAHEVLHIITRLCHSRWIPIRLENDEVMAYLMSWYMRELWLFLYPKKKKDETKHSKAKAKNNSKG